MKAMRSAMAATWMMAMVAGLGCGGGGARDEGGQLDAWDIPGTDADVAVEVAPEDADDATRDQTARETDIAPGEFGYPCNQNSECLSGFCVEGPEGFFCTQTCVENCPDGFLCRTYFSAGEPIALCVPDFVKGCSPCTQDAQCNGGRCLSIDGTGRCVAPCRADATCANPRQACRDVEPAAGLAAEKLCMPRTGSCSCLEDAQDGQVRTCTIANTDGTCYGVETCDATTGWGGCTAATPAVEECNGLDENCNGQIDEGLPATKACEVVEAGIGTCTGLSRCTGPLGWVCDARTPAPEACNGLDDDCNGGTDDGFLVNGAYGTVDNCGSCGASCAGLLANAVEACDAAAAGGPRCVVAQCDPGYYKVGDTQCFAVTSVLCLPCTAATDCPTRTCLPLGDASYCSLACDPADPTPVGYACQAVRTRGSFLVPTSGSCGCDATRAGQERPCQVANAAGTCYGFETCDPSGGWVSCTAATPAVETCNGLDDDCDGLVDEALAIDPTCTRDVPGVGTCTGARVCQGPLGEVCTALEPKPETCNYLDDDCDGAIDDGFLAEGAYATDANCGVCGNDCLRTIPHGTGRCAVGLDGPRCVVATCEAGYMPIGDALCMNVPDVVCSPCTADAQCPGGRCATIGDGTYCTRACDAGHPCPSGTACLPLDGADACQPDGGSCACTADTAGVARLCRVSNEFGTCYGAESCDPAAGGWLGCDAATPAAETCNGQDDDCDGLVDEDVAHTRPCANSVEGVGSCTGIEICTPGGYLCNAPTPAPETCDFIDNDCDGLIDEDFQRVDPASGATVYGDVDNCGTCGVKCADRIVHGTARCDLSRSVPTCVVEACDPGYYRLNEVQCIPAPDVACRPCDTDDQCFGSVCGVLDGKGFCLAPCDPAAAACVAGTACRELIDGRTACVPIAGTCDCSAANAGARRACSSANGFGTCYGFQVCDPVTGWSSCDAPYAAAETCDGVDNDCNGLADDGLPDTEPCASTNEFGTCAGTAVCYGKAGWVCQARAAEAERCDYLDNDCNGLVDEAFLVNGRYATYENCGSCGSSCGQGFPNAVTVCDASGELPMCTVASCDAGYVRLNDFQCIPDIARLCEPCLADVNCIADGAKCVDVGGEGSFCGLACETQADCDGKVAGYTCVDFGDFKQCIPATGSCTCDGTRPGMETPCEATSTPPGGTTTTCYGRRVCTASGWSTCQLPAEQCNLVDDNCDGTVDEGFADASGLYRTDENCGKCGNNCTLVQFGNAVGTCNTTVEPVRCGPQCLEGYFDLDANPRDCECHFLSTTDFPGADDPAFPSSLDVNCDGVDGEKDKAIFVAKNGNDANPGTIDLPKRTLQAGIDAAVAQAKRDVYVATGVYGEAIAMAPDVGIYGGYSADFRVRDAGLYESALLAPAPVAGKPGAVNGTGIQGRLPGRTVFDGFTVFAYTERTTGRSSYGVYLQDCDGSVRVAHNHLLGGSGGAGLRGIDGIDGNDGAWGTGGIAAFDLLATYGLDHCATKTQFQSPGGPGGTFQCGGVDVSGGAGGVRTCPAILDGTNQTTALPVAVESGIAGRNNAVGGLGGTPGRDVYHQAYSCDGYSTLGPVEGGNGLDGKEGTDGGSGSGCAFAAGQVLNGSWVPGGGSDGATGLSGGGGGGGGSGAGAWSEQSCFSKGFGRDNFGGSGGGGGSGGCQGFGGTAGTGAGGAFTVFVAFQAAPGTIPELTANAIAGGTGGTGGVGGNGGVGGSGGLGATGGAAGGGYIPPSITYPAFQGGKGGSGGRGGHGGGGGGGCGGPAYGIFLSGVAGSQAGAWKSDNTFENPGTGGAGGLGGFSLGEPGGDGAAGVAAEANF